MSQSQEPEPIRDIIVWAFYYFEHLFAIVANVVNKNNSCHRAWEQEVKVMQEYKKEYIVDGAAGGFGSFGGSGGMIFAVIILILIFLFFNRRDGYDNHNGHGGHTVAGNRPVFYDESNWEQQNHLRADNERTRALIDTNWRADQVEKVAALNGRINLLEMEKFQMANTAVIMNRLGAIECDLRSVPRTQPTFANTVSPLTTLVPGINPCAFQGGGRCGD